MRQQFAPALKRLRSIIFQTRQEKKIYETIKYAAIDVIIWWGGGKVGWPCVILKAARMRLSDRPVAAVSLLLLKKHFFFFILRSIMLRIRKLLF